MATRTQSCPPCLEAVASTPSSFISDDPLGGRPILLPRRFKFTKSAVEALPFVDSGQPLFKDTELPGFFLLVGKTRKTYVVQATDPDGRTPRRTVGHHGVITTTEARRLAPKILLAIREGNDPLREKKRRNSRKTLARFTANGMRCEILPATSGSVEEPGGPRCGARLLDPELHGIREVSAGRC